MDNFDRQSLFCYRECDFMSAEMNRKKIAQIKRYKKLKKIQRYQRQTKINILAAKFFTYASIPALTACPSVHSVAHNDINSSFEISSEMIGNKINNFGIDNAVKYVADIDGEIFLNELNRQHDAITSKPAGQARDSYIRSLYGNINYCNLAVITAMKRSEADYLQPFLSDLENPARCQSFIDYVKKTHPDCIRAFDNAKTANLKRGDIVILNVARRDENAVTASGKHTVTFDGKEFISFNSTKKYGVTSQSGDVIDMKKLRKKELTKRIEAMSYSEAMGYLMHLVQRKSKDNNAKTYVPALDVFAQNKLGKAISFDI